MECMYKFGIKRNNVVQWYQYKSEWLYIQVRFVDDISEATLITEDFCDKLSRVYKDVEEQYLLQIRKYNDNEKAF